MTIPFYDIISYILKSPPVFLHSSSSKYDSDLNGFHLYENSPRRLPSLGNITPSIFDGVNFYPDQSRTEGLFTRHYELLIGNKVYLNGTQEGGSFKAGHLIKGTRLLPDKTIEKGLFCNNQLIEGERIYSHGVKEKGIFKKFIKKGIRIFSDGNFEKGHFHHNELVRGEKYYHNGSTEEGQFYRGYLHGAGSITNKVTGSSETGIFEFGMLIKGIKNKPENIVETGWFVLGELAGIGRRCYPNKSIERGFFERGQLKHKRLRGVVVTLSKCWKKVFKPKKSKI